MPVIRESTGDSASEMEALYDRTDETGETETVEETEEVSPVTDLIDNKLLAGQTVKPGDRIILEVVAVRGDQTEVKYATEEEEPTEPSEDEQLAQLAEV